MVNYTEEGNGARRYRTTRLVEGAHGTQDYEVKADSLEEAVEKFNRWEDNYVVAEEFDIDPCNDKVTAADVWEEK